MDQSNHDYGAPSPDGGIGQRAVDRDSLLLAATLRRLDVGGPAPIRVRNLSPGGMMAENAPPMPVGTRVAVELRGIGEVTGSIAWAAEGRMGVAFDAQIDPKRARKPVAVPPRSPEPPRRVPL